MNASITITRIIRKGRFALVMCLVAMSGGFHGAISALAPGRGGPIDRSLGTSGGMGTPISASRSINLVIDDDLLAALGGEDSDGFSRRAEE